MQDDNTTQIPTSRIQARYRGRVLGWFDTAEAGQAAIDAARAEEENEDEAFRASRP